MVMQTVVGRVALRIVEADATANALDVETSRKLKLRI
jgi:hypothetical protein